MEILTVSQWYCQQVPFKFTQQTSEIMANYLKSHHS